MTISTTQIGTNTYQISIDGETSSANIINSLEAAIVAGGWAVHDTFNNGSQRIYRALCLDGVTYKYLGLFIDIATFKIFTTVYETWNNISHMGTNEVDTMNRSCPINYSMSGCDIIVMVNPRWCLLQSFILNSYGPWSGIVECVREAPEDTPEAGYPPFAWVCSAYVTNNYSIYGKYFSFPRSRTGLTGTDACAASVQTSFVRLTGSYGGDNLNNDTTYIWDTSKKIIHSLRPVIGTSEMHGRVVGLKAVHNIGSPFNKLSIPVDSTYTYSASGTNTEHWVLGNTLVATLSAMVGTGTGSGYASSTSSVKIPALGRAIASSGNIFYVSTSAGIYKVTSAASSLGGANIINGTSGTDFGDIIFDGKYVYAASSVGITRIDTTDSDTVTSLALPQGAQTLFWDGTWLWASARTTVANNSFYKIDTSSFTISATITQNNTAGNSIGGITTDFAGNIYTYDTSGKLNKIVISTGVVIALATIATNNCNNLYYDGLSLIVINFTPSTLTTYSISTAGTGQVTIQNAYPSSASTYSTTSYPLVKLQAYKFFYLWLTSNAVTSTTGNFLTTVSGYVGGGSSSSSQPSSVNSTVNAHNATFTDGARIVIFQNGASDCTFSQLTGICRPDMQNTSYNRLLLPK